MGVVLLVLATLLIPLEIFLRGNAYDEAIAELETNAFTIAARSNTLLWAPSAEALAYTEEMAKNYAAASGARVVITDAAGVALVVTDDPADVGTSFAGRPEIAIALSGEVASGERHSNTLGGDLFYVAVPALSGEVVKGAVRITFPSVEVHARLDAQLSLLWVVALSALGLAAIVATILAGSVIRPLSRLKLTAEAVAEGDLSRRSDERSGAPEIRALAAAYNRMSDRLAGLLDEQRRFSADASHQLRTPLTALRLRLETARNLLETDPAKAAARFEAAELETERLNDLIEALLALSRGELDDGSVVPVDLAAAAQLVVETWQPLAEEQQIELKYSGPKSLAALALEGSIEQVAGNLIDNALRVSSAGGTVEVAVQLVGERAELRVLDRGAGMSEDELSHAFDRFWRGDTSTAGTGIGLPIVRRLMEVSGGSVSLQARDGGGIAAIASFRSTTRTT